MRLSPLIILCHSANRGRVCSSMLYKRPLHICYAGSRQPKGPVQSFWIRVCESVSSTTFASSHMLPAAVNCRFLDTCTDMHRVEAKLPTRVRLAGSVIYLASTRSKLGDRSAHLPYSSKLHLVRHIQATILSQRLPSLSACKRR